MSRHASASLTSQKVSITTAAPPSRNASPKLGPMTVLATDGAPLEHPDRTTTSHPLKSADRISAKSRKHDSGDEPPSGPARGMRTR